MGLTRASVVVDGGSMDKVVGNVGEGDGSGAILCGVDGVLEQVVRVDAAIDSDDLHAGCDAGGVGGAADDGVGDHAFFVELEPDGVGIAGTAAASGEGDGLFTQAALPSAVLDAAVGGIGRFGVETLVEEAGPVVGRNEVEGRNELVEGVGLNLGAVVGASVEGVAEVIDGFLSVSDVVNDGGGFKPYKVALVVVVDAATPVHPATHSATGTSGGFASGSVDERTPGASGTAGAEGSGDAGQIFAVLLRGPEAAACGEHGAEVVGEAFIAPEQVGFHRLFEVGRGEVGGAAVLAVP